MTSWCEYQGNRWILSEPHGEGEVAEFAESAGFDKVRETSAALSEGVTREATWRIAPGLYLHYFEYPPAKASFVLVSGNERSEVDKFDNIVYRYFEPVERQDLLRRVDHSEATEDRALALRQLGLGAPNEADPDILARVRQAVSDSDPRVREAGVWSTFFPLWPEFGPILETVAVSDSKEELRELARFLIPRMRAADGNP